MWCLWLVVCIWINPTRAIIGGAPASPPEPDAAVIFVQKHGRSARLEGTKYDAYGYYTFLGIRYAEPPVGERRFLRPVQRRLEGEMSTKEICAPCPQPDLRQPGRVIGKEDCLCLNVFTPKMPGSEEGSPVVFFIHGGNYKIGSASAYGGQQLVQKDTILVTVQYRLASLGFLSSGDRDDTGNAGLFDIYAALQWVRDYIQFFGGNPSKIVVMGQGSGGSAASLIGLSNEGRAAHGVIALSGAPLSPAAVRSDPALHAVALADAIGCPKMPIERLLVCLRKVSVDKIIKADEKIQMSGVDTERFLADISGRSGSGAGVEGKDDRRGLPTLVEESPADSLEHKAQRVPLLTGVTSGETSRAVFGKYSSFLKDKLSSVKDFLKSELVGSLRGLVNGVQGLIPMDKVGNVVPGVPLADYYQALFDNTMNTVDGLTQVVEVTADAIFNFPAYQSVTQWSKGAPAFLYNFEYNGNMTKGAHFLPGMALTELNDTEDTKERAAAGPAHGDELAYIFEPLDENGVPINVDVSQEDRRVRESFVALISKFAHDSTPLDNNNKSDSPLAKFSTDSDSFIRIGETVRIDKNFRFCQMGIWGNMADRLSGALCKNLIGNLLSKLPLAPLGNLPSAPSVPLVPNLLGGKPKKEKVKSRLRLPFLQ